ncbi:MAG: VCBS repeat-containing protein, partial [Chloroflexi bacterium]|nr:VCBS repeat-containing protein [Chloroflexota bacterium]
WSPDGAKIAFYSQRDGNLEVYVTNTDGSIQTNITKHPDDDLSPAWSTDGRRIVFSSDRDSNQGTEIYVMDADGTNQTRLTSVAGFDVSPHWQLAQQPAPVTPEMRLAIRSDRSGDKEIYEIDLVGNIIRRLTDSPGEDGSPAYSPDGTRIAFYSDRNGPDFEIFVMNHDLSGLRQLTFDNVDDLSLTWCGNDRIAYMYDYNQIYIMNADGSDSRLLIGGQAPSCTSDGAALLVNQSGTIVKVDPQTGVGESLGSGGAAVWSPDGTQIALDDGKHLFVMDVASRVITQITDGPATDSNPQWAPGPAIVFTSDRPGNSEVYIINPDGSGLRNITRNAASDSQATWWVPPTQDIGGFAPAVNYPAGMSASAIKTGDVDGDGDLDVLTGNQVSRDIIVLYNDGQGVLGIANAFDIGETVVGITTPSDLDSDGDLDVVAALAPPDEMAVVLNDGSGNFSVTSTNSYGPATKSIADGDFDGDGDLDVAVPQESQGFRVFLNNGDGSFTSYGHMSASSGLPYQLAVGDLDGDLDLDIVGAINQSNKIEVFLNDGSGTFSSVSTYSTQTWPRGIVSVDVDMDGDLDVAVVNMTSNSVSVFMNDGSANLGDPKHYPTELEPRAIASGDFNQDGYPDLAVVNIISNSVSVFINRGDGTFEAPFNIGVGDGPNTIAVADLDGDTWPDIVTGNSDDVSVILNRGRGLRYIGAFEELAGRDLNHLHPSGQGVRVGNSYYVVSGESESLGVFTPQIERT